MASVNSVSYSIPPNLKRYLPQPDIPWLISPELFKRITSQPFQQEMQYRRCQILPSDPEFAFILEYFNHDKPPHYGIKNIYCIHTGSHTQAFESKIKNMELEADKFYP